MLLTKPSKVAIDPLIEPILIARNRSFFENKYGFSESDLSLVNEYREPMTTRQRRQLLNSIGRIDVIQKRGFKTRRSTSTEPTSGLTGFINEIKSLYEPKKTDSSDPFKSLLNDSSKTSSGIKLGEIRPLSSSSTSTSTPTTNSDLENKLKVAFVEGYMHKLKVDEKSASKRSFNQSLFRFFLFAVLVFIILNSVTISTPGNVGNGKNGSSSSGVGSGINFRALTGQMNFEISAENVTVKFEDVKGLPEAKKELVEIVDFLKDPEKYTKLGARLPKGVLLVGPPGCGKTLLAKAVAGEAGVPFFQASGSDFDEMFVGTGSKRVRQLFQSARAKAPCVVFIDEIDSVGSTRTNSSIHPHANQTINQLLAEMDGFQKNEGVIVLGATNRRDSLDKALLRPGRFDVEVRIDKPDLAARIEILEYYLDKVARDKDIDVKYLARQLVGFGGSSIENVVNQAALRAVVSDSKTVKMEHLEWALDRTLLGYGKSRIMDEECNRNTAFHEAGHVLVAYFTKDSNPVHKVTILPRSQSLGHAAFVPEKEGYSFTKSQLMAQMDVSMGGRVAEELIFGVDKVTTGASSDFSSATQMATQMVKMYGMSDKIGVRVFPQGEQAMAESLSPQTQELLDQEIKRLLQDSYERAKNILKNHSQELKILAEALLLHETLDAEQIKRLIENHRL